MAAGVDPLSPADPPAVGGAAAPVAGRATRQPPDRAVILAGIARDARLNGDFLLLIALSSALATLGLLQNSTAVVIGAMLVSPLMGPIMALGFGLAVFDGALLRRGGQTLLAGVAVAIAVAALIVLISPIKSVTTELAARTAPTLMDLGVALVGGVAGALSLVRRKTFVLVGVAIATALVPPLATAAFGIVTARGDFVTGALLLFFTNTAAIAGSAALVARLNRYRTSLSPHQTGLQTVAILASLGIVAVPLAASLSTILSQAQAQRTAETALNRLLPKDARVTGLTSDFAGKAPRIEAIVVVSAYLPALEARYARALAAAMPGAAPAVSVLQLVETTEASAAARRETASQLAAWAEERERERAIVAAVEALGWIDPASLLVDARRHRLVVRARDAGADPATMAAGLADLRRRFPSWQVEIDPEPGRVSATARPGSRAAAPSPPSG